MRNTAQILEMKTNFAGTGAKDDTVLFIACCALAGLIAAKLYKSNMVRWLFGVLKIKHTLNRNIWYDIIDYENTVWVYAWTKDYKYQYQGILSLVEDDQREPIIVLEQYTLRDKDGNLLADNTGKAEERTIIKTAECERVDLLYNERSHVIKQPSTREWKNFVFGKKNVG